jgi:glutathione S-transferase
MKIYGDIISPFVRMCLVTAHEAGLKDKVEFVKTAVKPDAVNPVLHRLSPIAKVPVLETDHGHGVHDSRVIIEYLVHSSGRTDLLPIDGVKRFRILTLEATAQGAADAAVSLRYEQAARPEEKRWTEFHDRQKQRVLDSMSDLEQNWGDALASVNVGSICAACFLGYVDFRHGYLEWRKSYPKLAAFEGDFAARDSMKAWALQ